ncbi:hypothetical protein EC844_11485 [Acinetobacter calcoaceticus]|uniref:Uncharacterized protein n=1 Tax=Acinetobacter calcoaceticus TaxID=471 RepID=A0A4R1XQR0_ACICA|nr:hypothetical protein EC844_11485 [Acinetobacter calcoaceticus]
MKKGNNPQLQFDNFPIFILGGPAIAGITIFIAFFLSDFFTSDEYIIQDIPNLISGFFIIFILSYLFGLLPAIVTSFIFNRIIKRYIRSAKLYHFIACGAFSVLLWLPVPLLIYPFSVNKSHYALGLISIMLYSSLICSYLSWRSFKKQLKIFNSRAAA